MEHATCHLYFLRIHTRLQARVYMENASDAWHIPRYPTRKHCITSVYAYFVRSEKGYRFLLFGLSIKSLAQPGGAQCMLGRLSREEQSVRHIGSMDVCFFILQRVQIVYRLDGV